MTPVSLEILEEHGAATTAERGRTPGRPRSDVPFLGVERVEPFAWLPSQPHAAR